MAHRFSRKVVWPEVSITNNDSSVIAGYYLQAVDNFGKARIPAGVLYLQCPKILRSDKGTENAKVAYLQPFLRRHGQDQLAGNQSVQYGRSASNQVIYNA